MKSDVYTISFVLEELHQATDPSYEVQLRFDDHDWCSIGEIDISDLPVGFVFTAILSSFRNAQTFHLDISASSGSSYLAQLQLPKESGKDVLSSRGFSVLYSTAHERKVLAITVAVKIQKYYHQPTDRLEITLRQNETQTERTDTRTVQTQVHRRCSTTASNTELHLLSESELEETVANVVAKYLHQRDVQFPPKTPEIEGAKTLVSRKKMQVEKPCKTNLGKSIVPRLQKLQVLDRMIGERTKVVEQFDASIVKQEIAKKREVILKARLGKVLDPQKRNPPSVSAKTREVAVQIGKASIADSSTSSSASTSSESSETTEQSDETSVESDETATDEAESLATSSSSSRETVVRRNSSPVPISMPSAGKEQPRNTKDRTASGDHREDTMSPTSLYLKQLREKILKERLEKA